MLGRGRQAGPIVEEWHAFVAIPHRLLAGWHIPHLTKIADSLGRAQSRRDLVGVARLRCAARWLASI